MKRILLLIFMLAGACTGQAYSQITTFSSSSFISGTDCACRLQSFNIEPDGVTVTFELKALKALNFMLIPHSSSTCIMSGDIKILELSGLLEDNVIYPVSNRGWDRVAVNETRTYKLYFKGEMPPGVTKISIVDRWGGFSFKNYTITNPRKNYVQSITTEEAAKQNINSNNDGICGIYEPINETGAILACVKVSGEYKLVYLSSPASYSGRNIWSVGDIKADLRMTASGIMKANWYQSDKTAITMYVAFDGRSMRTIDNKSEELLYLKTYPVGSPSAAGGVGASQGAQWTGTGFALHNGYVVTNNHVVEDASSIAVIGVNGNRNTEYKATVVATDKKNDLALIRINDSRFTGFGNIPYAVRNRICEPGEDIFVLGYPLTNYMGDEIKLTNGIISSLTGYQGDITTYQMSAPVQPGNSGGPMFDKNGDVVGIVNAGIPDAENVGYAIKTSYLYILVNSISSPSIIPTRNQVGSGALSDKVRSVKNYVFCIKCSK